MKKLITLLLLATLFGCSKKEQPEPELRHVYVGNLGDRSIYFWNGAERQTLAAKEWRSPVGGEVRVWTNKPTSVQCWVTPCKYNVIESGYDRVYEIKEGVTTILSEKKI